MMHERRKGFLTWLSCTILVGLVFLALRGVIDNRWLRMTAAGVVVGVAVIAAVAAYSAIRYRRTPTGLSRSRDRSVCDDIDRLCSIWVVTSPASVPTPRLPPPDPWSRPPALPSAASNPP